MIFRVVAMVRHYPILLLPLVFLIVEAGANAIHGLQRARAGGSPLPVWVLQAAMYAGAAILAAEIVLRWGGLARAQRAFAGLVLAGCLMWSQVCGWAILGTVMSDAQVARETQALQGDVTRGRLKGTVAELKSLEAVGTPAEVQSRIDAQLKTFIKAAGKTVGEATRNCAEPNWAPNICKRIDELKADLARAERKVKLEGQVSSGLAAVDKGPKVSSAQVDVAVPVGIIMRFGLASTDAKAEDVAADVRFWMQVFVVGMVSLLATFGFPLVGFDHHRLAHLAGDHGEPHLQIRGLLASPDMAMDDERGSRSSHASHRSPPAASDGLTRYEPRQTILPPASGASGGHAGHGGATHGGSTAHLAPNISINVGGVPPAASMSGAAPGDGARDGGQATSAPSRGISASAAHIGLAATSALTGDSMIGAPVAPDRPVDRSNMKAVLDQLQVFKAHALSDAPGMMVTAGELARQYRRWAGGRAMADDAFLTMFEQLVSSSMIGGTRHFHNVTFRIGLTRAS